MQWYERGNFYRQRLIREIEYIEKYKRTNPENKIQYGFWGKYKSFVVSYIYQYKREWYGILCTYPVLYPKTRIKVEVFEYDIYKKRIMPFKEGLHNTEGVLCLLNHYPNEWKEEYGIEYIIKRVAEWFENGRYDKNNILPVDLNIDNEIFVFPEPLLNDVSKDYKIFDYKYISETTCIATAICSRNESMTLKSLPTSFNVPAIRIGKGIVVFTERPMPNKLPTDIKQIKTYLNCFHYGMKGFFRYAENNGVNLPIPLVIIYKNQGMKGQSFFIGKDLELKVGRFSYFRIYEDIFSRIKEKDNLDFLKRKKIALIGLGAIGSTVAAELARSGIGEFVLIDYDKLEIQNIGRHDLTLKDIDKYKVKAVEEKILDINPGAKCLSLKWNVLDDYSYILSQLLNCSLVISTIDDQEAKFVMDSTLIPEGKKVIFAGAFYNSVAGYVLVSDKKMACFKCISLRMDHMADSGGIPNFSAMVPKEGIEYNCGIPTFPGGSINTHTVSLLASKIALDTLLGKREQDSNSYPYNLYLIGNEKIKLGAEDYFKGYMDVKKYTLAGIDGCEVCDDSLVLSSYEDEKYKSIMEKFLK